jgi:hypothetical protein
VFGVQEVPGSNPGGPTKYLKELQTQEVLDHSFWSPNGIQSLANTDLRQQFGSFTP